MQKSFAKRPEAFEAVDVALGPGINQTLLMIE